MRHGLLRRLACGGLLFAVLGVAGGPHSHDNLGFFYAGPTDGASRVVSNHSPLSQASHWHSGKRAQDDPCLACHLQRFAVAAARNPGAAPSEVGLFISHAGPRPADSVFRLCDPSRGPPSLS